MMPEQVSRSFQLKTRGWHQIDALLPWKPVADSRLQILLMSGSMRPPASQTISTHISQLVSKTPREASTPTSSKGSAAFQDISPQLQPEAQALPQPEPIVPTPTSTSPIRQSF
jgi:hypothetical protein